MSTQSCVGYLITRNEGTVEYVAFESTNDSNAIDLISVPDPVFAHVFPSNELLFAQGVCRMLNEQPGQSGWQVKQAYDTDSYSD